MEKDTQRKCQVILQYYRDKARLHNLIYHKHADKVKWTNLIETATCMSYYTWMRWSQGKHTPQIEQERRIELFYDIIVEEMSHK